MSHAPTTTDRHTMSGTGYGGFMGLEPVGSRHALPYPSAAFLSSGRACLAFILEREKPRRMHVPFYACDTLYDPITERGIEMVRYRVDRQLMPIDLPEPAQDELLILVDYFGVRTREMGQLAQALGPRCVLDRTHAYFAGEPPRGCYAFNSARKFRGVPDGAFLFAPDPIHIGPAENAHAECEHLILRNLGSGAAVMAAYKRNETTISTRIESGSHVSRELLMHLDHAAPMERRMQNFRAAHAVLGHLNELRLDPEGLTGPLNYPLLPSQPIERARLHDAGIFAAQYWPEVPARDGVDQHPEALDLATRLIAFPIDQRYSAEEAKDRAHQLLDLL